MNEIEKVRGKPFVNITVNSKRLILMMMMMMLMIILMMMMMSLL